MRRRARVAAARAWPGAASGRRRDPHAPTPPTRRARRRTSRSGTRVCRCHSHTRATTPLRGAGSSPEGATARAAVAKRGQVPAAESAIIHGPMTRALPDPARAFDALARRLSAARARDLGVRLWVVLGVLALAIAAFTYWQVRVPLDGALRSGGVLGAGTRLAVVLSAFVLAGATIAMVRQVALMEDPPGPEWLALPVAPALVERHLAREASAPA